MSEMSDVISAVFGAGGALVTIGGGMRWIWNKAEARFKAIETALEECRQREVESLERRAAQITVIELLWAKLHELAPDAPVLQRAKKLLDDLKAKSSSTSSEPLPEKKSWPWQ